MRKLMKWLAVAAVVMACLAVVLPQDAEARRWAYRYGPCYHYSPYVYGYGYYGYYAPPAVHVHVAPPSVRVLARPVMPVPVPRPRIVTPWVQIW